MRISGQSILGLAGAAEPAERHGPGDLPGPQRGRRRRGVRLQHPEPADRPCHAQPAPDGGLLARREHQPQRHLRRMLHRRAGRMRSGRTRSSSAASCSSPSTLAVLKAVAEKAGCGKPAPAGVFRGLAQIMGYGSYVAACAEVSVSRQGRVKIHRIVGGDRSRPRGQSGADRAADRGLVRLRALGAALRRDAPSRTAPSSRRTSTPTT